MNAFVSELTWVDLLSIIFLFSSYALYPVVTDRMLGADISRRMMVWREAWARQMLWREERITDVGIVRGLIGNVAFFATTTVFVISGLVALLGSSSTVADQLNGLPHIQPATEEAVAVKIAAFLTLSVIAFFKFGWSMRLHANTLTLVGAAPHPEESESAYANAVVEKLAEMSALASLHFRGGVRAYYFGFAAIPWLLTPWLLFPSLALVTIVSVRRDFKSKAFSIAGYPEELRLSQLGDALNVSERVSVAME
ncbi:DUF599 family protein [Aliiroseovarius subalbicans]|uniref:DUF599 domain-containing protein n=1 Tax=Aliiroseovarius subalbicans TaxID=2925840 RepID=UPI001F5B001A|nr:DUF599 family protein [Aliiroseovarius subalbicans]MCI2399067.1 DUF599 domain-containing protein [Aliiroseovarius subalbicans]